MHGGIQKFGKELNGVFVRTLTEDVKIVNVLWVIKEIKGGSRNAEKLIDHVIETIIFIHPLPNHENVYHEILSFVTPENVNMFPENPPDYFKARKLLYDDKQNYEHSKTINIQDISDFVQVFRKIMKHFKHSTKYTSLITDVLDILCMKKVHLITFCLTRIAYLLDSCLKAVELLVPIFDVLISAGVKMDETDSFLTPKDLFIMHILADLQPVFNKFLPKAVDKGDRVIIDAFQLNKGLADYLSQKEFECSKLKAFVQSLSVNDNGNVFCSIKQSSEDEMKHDIQLNFNYRPSRGNISK